MSSGFEWREAPAADYGVIGDPISHSLSPPMQRAAFAELGLSLRYEAIRVPEPEFDQAVAHLATLGYRGLNVTVPLKERAYRWAQSADELTKRIGAANTLDLSERRATNTDAGAFLDLMRDLDAAAAGSVLVLGAGGTARAVAVALDSAGIEFALWNRTLARAEQLTVDLGISASVLGDLSVAGFKCVVNTTAAELAGKPLSIDWLAARSGAVAIDFFYGPEPTGYLRGALAAGLRTVDGRWLLAAQGARSLEWWLGRDAPRSAMLNAIV